MAAGDNVKAVVRRIKPIIILAELGYRYALVIPDGDISRDEIIAILKNALEGYEKEDHKEEEVD